MSNKAEYTLSRSKAAKLLGVSTRTIDRYVKKGKISYKKVANKVLLNQDEIFRMKKDYDMLKQQENTSVELVKESKNSNSSGSSVDEKELQTMIDNKIEKFFMVFKEKEKLLEDKNKIIFMLQQRVGELENKIQSMIALPDYNSEKQKALLEKEKLEQKISSLQKNLRTEKTKGMVSLGFLIFVVITFIVIALITGQI